MIKILFVALWACAVMFGASYGATAWLKSHSAPPVSAPQSAGSETRKTKELNIPILRNGSVTGYVVLQLNYVVDLTVAKTLAIPPDDFVIDEAFRYVFDDQTIDFTHLDRLELDKLTRAVTYKVNSRMKGPVITDMGVQECNFLLNAEAGVENKLDPRAKP
jgi:hypothetical protein